MKKNTGLASIFDNLQYEHRDLNEVDETSPFYQPPLPTIRKSKKGISFHLPPQEMVDSDTGFTSDDLSSHRRVPQEGLSEMDKLLALSNEEFNTESRSTDCFSEMFGLAMEDSSVAPEGSEGSDEIGHFENPPEETKGNDDVDPQQDLLQDDDLIYPEEDYPTQTSDTQKIESNLDDDDDLIPDFSETIDTSIAASSYQEEEKKPEAPSSPKQPVLSTPSKKSKVSSKEAPKKRRVATATNTKSKNQ